MEDAREVGKILGESADAVGIASPLRDTGTVSAIPHSVKVSVAEYLATSYRPDCDYVDGILEERNLGEKEHAILQRALTILFGIKRDEWRVEVYPELRVQVSPTRFRIPDITVTAAGLEWQRILRTPALLFVEILSPEDTMARVRQRVDDYLKFGTEHVWIVDPSCARRTSRLGADLKNLQTACWQFPIPKFA
jgi:Uma2 family endonuclease